MKKSISFITVASKKTGMGHLIRSLALAQMLVDKFDISFIIDTDSNEIIEMIKAAGCSYHNIKNPTIFKNVFEVLTLTRKTDIVIIDFYKITEAYQLAVKSTGAKLVCIDDLNECYFYADAIINPSSSVTAGDYSREGYTRLLLGSKYVLLRPVFLRSALLPPQKVSSISSVFINMGGADLPDNTSKFLNAIININDFKEIHIVTGLMYLYADPLNDIIKNFKGEAKIFIYDNLKSSELNDVLLKCQLAIVPASGISTEICAAGLGIITGHTAENQKLLLSGLVNNNCATSLGDFNTLPAIEISNAVKSFLTDLDRVNEMIINQKQLIDGLSPQRIRQEFELL